MAGDPGRIRTCNPRSRNKPGAAAIVATPQIVSAHRPCGPVIFPGIGRRAAARSVPPRDLLLAIGIELPRLARCPCPVTLAARVALAAARASAGQVP